MTRFEEISQQPYSISSFSPILSVSKTVDLIPAAMDIQIQHSFPQLRTI